MAALVFPSNLARMLENEFSPLSTWRPAFARHAAPPMARSARAAAVALLCLVPSPCSLALAPQLLRTRPSARRFGSGVARGSAGVDSSDRVTHDPPSFDRVGSVGQSRRFFLAAAAAVPVAVALAPQSAVAAPAATAGSSATATATAAASASAAAPAPMAPVALTQIQEAISGSISGAVVSTTKLLVKHPLDTVSVRLQVAKAAGDLSARELWQGAFVGVVPPLITAAPTGAVFFGVKDVVKAALRDGSLGGVVLSKEAATVAAVFVAQFPYWALRNPSEVVHVPPPTTHHPPPTNRQPPTTNRQPPTANRQPPTTNHQPPHVTRRFIQLPQPPQSTTSAA